MNSMTATLILGLITVIILFITCYIFYIQYSTRKAIIGRNIATILSPAGRRTDKLLEVEGNQLWDEVKGRKLPYMIRPDKSFDIWWPIGKPKLLQVSVKSFLYAEGNPEPIDPFERPPVMTSEVLGNLQDINFSKAMVGRTEEIVDGDKQKKPSFLILYILIGVSIIVSLGAVFMALSGGLP